MKVMIFIDTLFVDDTALPLKCDYPTKWGKEVNEWNIKIAKNEQERLKHLYDAAVEDNPLL